MSKIKMNATTYELVSAMKLDDIKMLESINSPALAIRDKDGNCIFKVMSGRSAATCESAVQFADHDVDGFAVMTFAMDTDASKESIYEEMYKTVGAWKGNLDLIEASAAKAVDAEKARKAAFINELGGTDAAAETDTAAQ